jgi:hypothetical protein
MGGAAAGRARLERPFTARDRRRLVGVRFVAGRRRRVVDRAAFRFVRRFALRAIGRLQLRCPLVLPGFVLRLQELYGIHTAHAGNGVVMDEVATGVPSLGSGGFLQPGRLAGQATPE